MAAIKVFFFKCSGQSQILRPVRKTDSTEALKKRILRSLLRLDFHTTVSLLLAAHAFAFRISRSFVF